MILEHYTAEPFVGPVRNEVQDDATFWRGKPRGLWLSVKGKDDWPSWCDGEQWGQDRLIYCNRVNLVDGANILHIRGARALTAFGRKYGRVENRYGDAAPSEWDRRIDWCKVAAAFDGIIIAPYIWHRRLDVGWYYGWDCASGCIWNASAIASVESAEADQRLAA